MSKPAAFANKRARLQRLKDAKFFAGWVKALTETEMHIRLKNPFGMELGDHVLVEVHGSESVATFPAVMTLRSGEDAVFRLAKAIIYVAAKENARISVAPMQCIVQYEGSSVQTEVVDVSAGGFGMLAPQAFKRGDIIQVEIESPFGPVACGGEVRYCKPDAEASGSFRVGIRTAEMERLEKARWNRLFTEAA